MRTTSKKNTAKAHIVILGGGLAGLSAGYELASAGRKVTVIERWDDVGGLARTIKVGEFKFDTGPHRWYTKSDMVNNWMLNLLGDQTIQVPRLTRIFFDNKFFQYPIKIFDAMKGIGIYKSVKSVIDYFIARINYKITKKRATTLEDGYIAQFGKTLYETFFKRYSEKLWGKKCSQVSADWIGQRTRGFNITTILKETVLRSKKTVSFVDEFSYPKDGIGELAHRLALGIKKSQGKILLNNEIVKVNHNNSKITSIVVQEKNIKKEITGDYFISSIAISDFISILTPKATVNILQINKKFKYRDEVQVALFVKKEKITKDTWIYVHPWEIPFMRLMEMDNWSDRLSPAGTTTLVFEIACNEGDTMWNKSNNELIEMVTKSYITAFKLIKREDVIGGYVHRVPKEYPVYHLGYKNDLVYIKQYLSRYTNLQLVGRNGIFRYNNMDHSIEMGLYSAWNIITGEKKFDIESVNIEREYLEEKKIENMEDEKVEKNE